LALFPRVKSLIPFKLSPLCSEPADAPAADNCEDQFSIREQLLLGNVQRFRGGLVFKAHRLCVSLNSRLETKKEEEKNCEDDQGSGLDV